MKNLTVRILLNEASGINLNLRHTLVDTLEEREIGEVWDECIGEKYMEVNVYVKPSKRIEKEIKAILESLGLLEGSELIYTDIP
ncbi:hypothetical protein GCM10011387_27660 [Pedobacter quisquiliarum]|uniref:Uncharacterized protein n=1 Tax=Pedobacter quisquiliarum TaxID=1834438 RepID=A0A916UIY1_9SPHI|nr:hypothetical protein [Pedobacter quisquiliarum]GGC72626.1 hypothetical protein GCM10011387_27660 [Pedobacter quisquiliarum]